MQPPSLVSNGGRSHVFPQKPITVEVAPEQPTFDRDPDGMSVTERKLYDINPDDHEWRKQFFSGLPDYLARYFAKRYITIYQDKGEKGGRHNANTFLRERMGGELQRRIRMVMEQYKKLPTWNKVALLSDNAEQSDFDEEPPCGQYSLNLETVKPKRANNKILAELERDELKEMAFIISNTIKTKVNELSEAVDESLPYVITITSAYMEVAALTSQFGVQPPIQKKNALQQKMQNAAFCAWHVKSGGCVD